MKVLSLALVLATVVAIHGQALGLNTTQASAAVPAAKLSPFFCDQGALTPAVRKRHFDVLGPALIAKRMSVRELPDGYEFQLPSDATTYKEAAEYIDGERLCCPFFDISLRVTPEGGPLWMRFTGRPGTKAFIAGDGADWISPVPARTAPAVGSGNWTGKQAPDFALNTLDGRSVRLSSLRGKVVLLNFWATWCAPCRIEMPWLVDFSSRYRRQGLEIVGVSVDDGDREKVAAFVGARHVNYTIALKDEPVIDAYGGLRYLPQTFFIDRDGRVIKQTYGVRGKDDFEDDIRQALDSAPAHT
jgi:peroxiredoxin